MGRPERSLDPDAGPAQRLAHELRELRRSAGSPSYRTMAQGAGFSATSLSDAARGKRLPSLAVVQAYVRACGGDPGEWEPRWKEAEAAVAGMVREGDEDASPPYRGLARFEPDDRALFFGRHRLVEELRELVRANRFAVLFGASGSGKSSLLRAGLIPRLREAIAQQGQPAVLRILTPGPLPATTYGRLLTPTENGPESWVIVDQFEEVFTLCRDHAERDRFIDLLLAAGAPGSRVRVLIAVRADFYARCAELRGLAEAISAAGLLVGPMSAEELREAVIGPAQATGLLVERELTARIVEEVLDQPGGLPMLSHALLETWRRRRSRLLTLAAYEAAGGVRGAIAATAEEVYGQLSTAQVRTTRQLLLRLIEPGEGTADTRRPLARAELDAWADPSVELVLERLTRARLLTVYEDGAQLAHEALITSWPRLRHWIEEDRERLRHHRRLADAARIWLEHDRDPGALYRGTRLARAEELLAGPAWSSALTGVERAFFTAALDAREAERKAAARATRRGRIWITSLSAVLIVALVAGLVALQQRGDNQRRRTEDTARRVAQVADALRATDPHTAMLLGAAAWRIAPLPETRSALLGSLAQPETDTFTDPDPSDTTGRYLVDAGRTLLSADDRTRTWTTWDVTTHRRTGSGRLPEGQVIDADPHARLLALATADGIRLWDRTAGKWTGGSGPLPLLTTDLFIGLSGNSYLVGSTEDDRVLLRSATNGRVLFETRTASLANVAPSDNDRMVAVCPSGGSPQVRDLSTGRALSGAWESATGVCDDSSTLVFAPGKGNSHRFAAVSDNGVRVWDTRSGRQVADIVDPDVQHAVFTEDGTFLATADGDEIRVWRLSAPQAPMFRHPLNNQDLSGGTLAWASDRPVLRYLESGTVHTLDVAAAVTTAWRTRTTAAVLLSPDGRTLATAELTSGGYRVQLRDTRDGHLLRTLPSPPLPTTRDPGRRAPVVGRDTRPLLAFSPEGTAFAYGITVLGRRTAPERFTIWDLTHDRERTVLDLATPEAATAVLLLALGPGGRTLYATHEVTGELRDEAWDVAHHRRTAVFPEPVGRHLTVRPDGRLLVGDDLIARLPSGPATRHSLAQGGAISALAFGPDGSRLAVGDHTGRVTLWDGAGRDRTGILRNVFSSPIGDTPEAVTALALSPDGTTLAVGGDAGSLQLWDVATQQPLGGMLPTSGEAVRSLAFSSDATTLYSSSDHVPVQRYTIAPSHAVARACARADGDLTRTEWRTYIPDTPYRRVCD